MIQIHVVFRRINPALKIDLAQVGYIKDGQFANLPDSFFENTILPVFLKSDSISDSFYIPHSDISKLVADLSSHPGFAIEYFDNTLVLMFDLNIDPHEITSKEEGEGD
jgi:hypothetical protein